MSELIELAGRHVLDGVDFSNESIPTYEGSDYTEDSQVCRFRLNGNVFVAMEDPGDGYRSSMRDIRSLGQGVLDNMFPPVEVFALHRKERNRDQCDILEIYDIATGKIVLEIGTDATDDYYPSFVASFHPENMSINTKAGA
jgi:hypothetical protein